MYLVTYKVHHKTRKDIRTMKKLIPLLLAIIMIVGVFAACNDTKPAATTKKPSESEPKDTGKATGDASGDVIVDDTPTEEKLNLDLDAIDYGNQEFFIYHWQTSNPEFDVNEEAEEGDPINEALYQRNLKVEEGLGIKLNFHGEPGGDNQQTSFRSKYELRIQDPETPVDLIASYSRAAPYMMIAGHTVDLYSYSDDLDISKAWWPNNVREEHEIKGRLFYTSGDASTGLLTMMEIFFVNKTLLGQLDHDYEQFIKDIMNKKWTIDKFIEMTKDVYQDMDDKKGKSEGDMFGLVTGSVTGSDSLYIGMGYKLFEISTEDDVIYTLSDDLGDNTSHYVKKITEWWDSQGVCLSGQDGMPSLGISGMEAIFSGSRALFLSSRIGYFNASTCEVDFTIVPAPLADENQKIYLTNVGNPYSLFSIASASSDKQLTARALQALGYYGYTYTTPALFEVTFKGKYAKDDYAIELFDIIRSGITFEIGRTFDRYTSTMLPNQISGAIASGKPWGSAYSAQRRNLDSTRLENLSKTIFEILETLE